MARSNAPWTGFGPMVTSDLLAFVAADRREFAGLLRNAERVARIDSPVSFACTAWLNGRAILMVANGPGPKLAARAAEIAKEYQDLEALASIGFCGALNPALQACDIFVATEVLDVAHALSVPRSHSCERPCKNGKLLSIDHVVSTASEKARLHKTGADAVEMEAAGVASKASKWNIPFYAIRVVTDTAAESFPLDFNQVRDSTGRFSHGKIVARTISRPALMPALLQLNRRCKAAAEALGDFIADTCF
jgi:adenosylhomocysteine nucleosidase